jgi:hypothetical protein
VIRAGLLTIPLASLLSCGGMDPAPPTCARPDLPNCGLQGHTVVKGMFDHYPEWSFAMDSCVDFGALRVHVDAVDPTGLVVASQEDDCGAGQVTFTGLPEGTYTMSVTPLGSGGVAVVNAPTSASVAAGTFGANTEVTTYVPWTAWLGTYTGTFLFRISWNGMSCADVTPPIMTQVLTLMSNGQPVDGMTDNGQRLDGTDPRPCRALGEAFPQSATNLPFGPATLIVTGRDPQDHMAFQHRFDTFIGAGITNPTITYDLPPTPPDAGVDSM